MREVPDEKKNEIISRWLNGDYRDKISSEMALSSAQVTSTINEWKREIGSAIAEAYRGVMNSGLVDQGAVSPSDIVQAFKLMLGLKKYGVEPQKFEDFAGRLSKMAISTGVEPEGLASIVNQVLKLAELDGIEIHEVPTHLESLQTAKKALETEIDNLRETKDSISKDLPDSESPEPSSAQQLDNQLISQLLALSGQIKQFGLSMDDISAFAEMINNAKRYGYDFASIVDFASSLGSLEQEKNNLESELQKLREMKDTEQARQRSIEEELSRLQEIRDSITKLAGVGFDLHDFELMNDLVQRVAEVNNISDRSLARKKFFEDIVSIYSSSKAPVRIADNERSMKSQEQTAETTYSKEHLEMIERLASKGITEQTLMKCLVINEIFKLDLDSLADDLKKYSSVKNAAKRLEDRRSKLESEELVLKHKILALEERRQQTTIDMRGTLGNAQMSQLGSLEEKLDLTPLIRRAKGEKHDINPEELSRAMLNAIDLVSQVIDPQSLTRKILDHAKFSLQHEPSVPHNSL